MISTLALGQVVSHAPEIGGVNVIFRSSGQMAGYPVRILYQGAADAWRINQEPLPGLGTWGLIAFPNNDERNGVWLGALYANQMDAVTSGPGEPFTKYLAHQSGYWEHLNLNGDKSIVFPDGTSIVISETGQVADTYRHSVNTSQVQERLAITQAERVPNPPSPKYISINTASGVSIVIAPNGAITLNTPNTATLTASAWTFNGPLTWNGASTFVGNMQVNGNIQASQTIADYNGAYGNINLIRSTYDLHTHPTPNGTSGVPNQQLAD
jgi:phage baseplate assembly protein gpV